MKKTFIDIIFYSFLTISLLFLSFCFGAVYSDQIIAFLQHFNFPNYDCSK